MTTDLRRPQKGNRKALADDLAMAKEAASAPKPKASKAKAPQRGRPGRRDSVEAMFKGAFSDSDTSHIFEQVGAPEQSILTFCNKLIVSQTYKVLRAEREYDRIAASLMAGDDSVTVDLLEIAGSSTTEARRNLAAIRGAVGMLTKIRHQFHDENLGVLPESVRITGVENLRAYLTADDDEAEAVH